MRPDNRLPDQLRPITFVPDYTDYAEGSVLVTMGAPGLPGGTRVLCNASITSVAAVSVGIVAGEPRLDLCYAEDSQAEVDCNVVMTAHGRFVQVQGAAERDPFDRALLDQLLTLAERGIRELMAAQDAVLK